MAKSIAEITTGFTDFLKHFREYCEKQGRTEYDPDRFRWFRPQKVTDTTDLKNISEPYDTDELDKFGEELTKSDGGNAGDYALVMTQHDLMIAASRAHAERYKSKLRHFAHAAGNFERIADDYGVLQQGVMLSLQEIKKRASSDTP
jgi:outer membrane receptor for ferric coprogen and ferric-rhodotorulic acid